MCRNCTWTSGFSPKGEILSSHDILDYSNTHFTKSFAPTCSDMLRHAPKHSDVVAVQGALSSFVDSLVIRSSLPRHQLYHPCFPSSAWFPFPDASTAHWYRYRGRRRLLDSLWGGTGLSCARHCFFRCICYSDRVCKKVCRFGNNRYR